MLQRFVVTPNEQVARDAVHPAQHRRHAARLRRSIGVEERAAVWRRAADARRHRPQRADAAERAALGSPAAARHLRPAAGDPHLLRLRVRRQRPVHASTARLRQVMLSARELNSNSLPNRTWVNERLTFTHGYGLTLGPVNQVTTEGLPVLFVRNLPPETDSGAADRRAEPLLRRALERLRHRPDARRASSTTRAATTTSSRSTRATAASRWSRCWRKLLFALRFGAYQILLQRRHQPPRAASCSTATSRERVARARAVPDLRSRPVPGARRRPAVLDVRRLHDERAAIRIRRRPRAASTTSATR